MATNFPLRASLYLFSMLSLAPLASADTEFPYNAVVWATDPELVISPLALASELSKKSHVVIGEVHNDRGAQNAEAWLLDQLTEELPNTYTLGWEFLNWSEREKITASYGEWVKGEATDRVFFTHLFGSSEANLTYLTLLQVARDRQLPLLATNLSREEKRPVVERGIGAIDPRLLPTGFELGGEDYHSRFVEAMGGHGDPRQIENYFAAQCVTDDVIAEHLTRDLTTPRSFLVVGNFHTAYKDGLWNRFAARHAEGDRALVHIEKFAQRPTPEEQRAILHDAKYGTLADYVIFLYD